MNNKSFKNSLFTIICILIASYTCSADVIVDAPTSTEMEINGSPVKLGTIIIRETEADDFHNAAGVWQYYKIELPPGFQFATQDADFKVTWKRNGTTIDAGYHPYTPPTDGSTSFTFQYSLENTGNGIDSFLISNFKIKAVTGATNGTMLRGDLTGAGVMDGNPPSNPGRQIHANLKVAEPAVEIPSVSPTLIKVFRGVNGVTPICNFSNINITATLVGNGNFLRWYDRTGTHLESYDQYITISLAELGFTSSTAVGTYTVSVRNAKDASGTDLTDPVNITIEVSTAPSLYLFASDNEVCPNEPVTFIASPPNGSTVFDTYKFFKKEQGPGSSWEEIPNLNPKDRYTINTHIDTFSVRIQASASGYSNQCYREAEQTVNVFDALPPNAVDMVFAYTKKWTGLGYTNDTIDITKELDPYGAIYLSIHQGYNGSGKFTGDAVTFFPDNNETIFYTYRANSGSNQVTYSYISGSCEVEVNFNLMVKAPSTNKILGPGYCSSDPAFKLTAVSDTFPGLKIYDVYYYDADSGRYVTAQNITFDGADWIFNPATGKSGRITYQFRLYDSTDLNTPPAIKRYVYDRVQISGTESVSFSGLLPEYCSKHASTITLTPQPGTGIFTYYKINDSTNVDTLDTYSFKLQTAQIDTGHYKMVYIESFANCESKSSQEFKILRSPEAEFHLDNGVISCTDNEIRFINTSENTGSSIGYIWDFGDNETSKDTNAVHTYLQAGNYTVLLSTKDYSNNCATEKDTTISIGEFPNASFRFKNVCEGNFTDLINTSSIIEAKINDITWSWDFGDGYVLTGDGAANISNGDISSHNNLTNGTYRNPSHQFLLSDTTYKVKLTVSTLQGCSDSDSNYVSIFPTISFSNGLPYLQPFNSDKNGWISSEEGNKGNNSSWRLIDPDGRTIKIAASSPNCWITSNLNNVHNENENSWVESPCFNLSDLDRPMISLKTWSQSEEGYDGAVLQYAIDGINPNTSEVWNVIGNVDEGEAWYNTNVISSGPGGQTTVSKGWSADTAKGWSTSKYSLDNVKNSSGASLVRFRIAFASNEKNIDSLLEGFAFDDVFIGQRKRVVLFEHFTNMNSTLPNEETIINDFISNNEEIIKLQYHTNFPGYDSINNINKADPSARALHYGVSQVPRTVLDGTYFQNKPFSSDNWGSKFYSRRTLADGPFSITIDQSQVSDSVNFNATFHKNEAEKVINGPYVVQLAIVKKEITASNGRVYTNVVEKLIPNAAGTRISEEWSVNEEKEISRSWKPKTSITSPNNYRIVAFIQDENTKEIYQAAYIDIDPSILSQLPPPSAPQEGGRAGEAIINTLSLYPNPTTGNIYLEFDDLLPAGYTWQVLDVYGRKIDAGVFTTSADTYVLSTEEYQEGMYTLQIGNRDSVLLTKKVSVIR